MYEMHELVNATGYTAKTIQRYRFMGLIDGPSRRGPGAEWPPSALKTLLAFKKHMDSGRRTRADISEAVTGVSPGERIDARTKRLAR